MSRDASLQKIAAWIQQEDEELLYEPDCGEPLPRASEQFRQDVAALVARYPASPDMHFDGTLLWPVDDPLGLPMLDASEE